jgi:hypothetical protein
MLNVYKFYDKPKELELREYASIKFTYDSLGDFVDKIAKIFYTGNIPEKYELIERVFSRVSDYYTHVMTNGDECYLAPEGVDNKSSYRIDLSIEDGVISGEYIHYGTKTKFYESRAKLDHEPQMDEILTLGLTKLAEAELND